MKYKRVPFCCDGYTAKESQGDATAEAKCVPYCEKCLAGVCIAPGKCQCEPGFRGDDCAYGKIIFKLSEMIKLIHILLLTTSKQSILIVG